jgi:hypothetical protein
VTRGVRWGIAAAAAYLAVAALIGGPGPVRPLYDSFAPPGPYRWVKPPRSLATTNQRPLSARQEIGLSPTGSFGVSVATQDVQAAVVFKKDAFAPRAGEIDVVVLIEPLDPATIGAPPDGERYDGNAYRVTATYPVSGDTAALRVRATIVLRFPSSASSLLTRIGSRWRPISSSVVPQSLEIYGDAPALGEFVAAGVEHAGGGGFPWIVVSIGGAAAAALTAVAVRRIKRRPRAPGREAA